jgi:autotransporter-associated beta strand protein
MKTNPLSRFRSAPLILSVVTLTLTAVAPAADQFYDSTNPAGVWDTTTLNWDGSTAAWTNGNSALFDTGSGTVSVSPGITLAELVVSSITESTIGGVTNSVYRFNGGSLGFGATNGIIDTSGTGLRNSQINSRLLGTAGLKIYSSGADSGNGRLTLGGDNTGLTGGITLMAGLTSFTSQAAAGSNTITLEGGGIFGCTNHSGTGTTIVNGADQALSNPLVLQSLTTNPLRVWGGRNLVLLGTLSGDGGFRKVDTGTLVLGSTPSFTGELTLVGGGVVSPTLQNLSTGTLTYSGASQPTFGYYGSGETVTRQIHIGTGQGGILLNHGPGQLQIATDITGAASPFGFNLSGGGVSSMNGINSGALINFNKEGLGIWTVNGQLTLTGGGIRPRSGILSFSSTASTASDAPIAERANANGVLRFATGSSVKTATANNNGILGGWATFDQTTWAKTNGAGNAIDGFTAFTDNTWAAGTNTNVTLAGADPATNSTTHSLRFNEAGAKSLSLSGTNTLTSGGIMVTAGVGANPTTITGGTLTTTGANNDLVVHQLNPSDVLSVFSVLSNNVRPVRAGSTTSGSNSITGLSNTADLTTGMLITGTGIPANATITAINSASQITISANATATGTPNLTITGVTALTKTGEGTLVLSGANSYTGTTRIYEGTLRATANSGGKIYQVGSQGRLEIGYTIGTGVYGYGVLVNGNGTSSTNGVYFEGGRNYNLQGTLRLAGAPSTVRQFGSGSAVLHGFDTNGTHLAVEATASGSVIGPDISFQPGGFGYVMNISPGPATVTGDVVVQGVFAGGTNANNTHYRKVGHGSMRIVEAATATTPFQIRQGTVILAGGDDRLGSGSSVRLGEGADSGRLVLEGINQTFTSLTNAGTGTDNRVIGGSATLSTLSINNDSDSILAAAMGGAGLNHNNLALVKNGIGNLVLSGANTFTGDTTVNAGGLQLDFSTHNNSKLSDTGTLTLGGNLVLSGGSHEEIVGQTIVTGTAAITRPSGSAVINLGTLSRTGSATLNIAAPNLARTSTPNDVSGRLPNWVTIDGSPAANDGSGNIVVFVPTFTNVFRLGGQIPNNPSANVRIVDGGSTGPVTLAASGTSDILSLTQGATGGPATVSLGGNTLRLGEIGVITAPAGAASLTLQGGTLTAGGADETTGTLSVTGEAVVTIDSVINDNGTAPVAFVKSGPGTATLSGMNNHTGGVTLNAGKLNLGGAFSLGLSGILTINGGTIDNTTGAELIVNDSFPQVWGGNFTFLGSNDLVFQNGGVNITGNREITVAASTLDIRTQVSGSAGFTKLGAGTLLLSNGSSNWTGTTTVTEGVLEIPARSADNPYVIDPNGTLRLGYTTGGGYVPTNIKLHGAGVEATTGLYLAAGASYNASGTIELLTAPTTIRHYGEGLAAIGMFDINGNGMNVSTEASGSVIDGNIQMISRGYGMSMTIASGAATTTGDLVINGPLNIGNGGLYKRGTGSVRLNGTATTDNLGVQIQGGRVIAGAAGALGANAILPISGGAVLDLNGFDQEAATLSGAGAVINGGASPATLEINQATSGSFAGVLGGASPGENAFTFVKDGTATLTLSGANTYSGDTVIKEGTLSLGQAYLADTSAVRVTTGATLDLSHGQPDTVAELWINGVQQPANTYNAGNSSFITGTGSLVVTSGPSGDAFVTWATSKGLDGTPGKEAGFDADPDGDGFANGLEWILGGEPLDGKGGLVTASATAGGGLTLSFTRSEDAIGQATLSVEYNATLAAPWDSALIGATSSGPDANGVTVNINTAPTPDTVTINIPASNAVGGKLFGRLKATKP